MNILERCFKVIRIIFNQRKTTIGELAERCDCSKSTVRRILDFLERNFPIQTVQGRFGGGVQLDEGYYPYSKKLSPEQVTALMEAIDWIKNPNIRRILGGILAQFCPTR